MKVIINTDFNDAKLLDYPCLSYDNTSNDQYDLVNYVCKGFNSDDKTAFITIDLNKAWKDSNKYILDKISSSYKTSMLTELNNYKSDIYTKIDNIYTDLKTNIKDKDSLNNTSYTTYISNLQKVVTDLSNYKTDILLTNTDLVNDEVKFDSDLYKEIIDI